MSSEDKDLNYALLAARLLKGLGFYCRVKVPVFLSTYRGRYASPSATDADVLGVRFDGDFSRVTAVAEAKSGPGKALEEVMKLRSVGEYLQAGRLYYVKEQIPMAAREFARRLGVLCLTEVELRASLKSLGLSDTSPSRDEIATYVQPFMWFTAMRKAKDTQRLGNYLQSGIWSRPYWENMNNVVYLLRHALQADGLKNAMWRSYVLLSAATGLGVACLDMCRDVLMSSRLDVDGNVETLVFGGADRRRQHQRLKDVLAGSAPAKLDGFELDAQPPFLPELKELVAYLMMSPLSALQVPTILGNLSEVVAVEGGRFDESRWLAVQDSVAMKLAKDVLQFTANATGVSTTAEPVSTILRLA